MLTLISPRHLKSIISLSGSAIRSFLSESDAKEFKGEACDAINSFKAKPSDFSDKKLVAYGSDMVEAINYPVRIEVRGQTKEGAAQVVSKGIWGPKRERAVNDIANKCKALKLGLHLKLAGTSSIEFNVEGVDKSVPIRFLQAAFEDVLKEMKYKPGTDIDSRLSKIVIAADGDSTIYDGPRIGVLPGLADSPVKDSLISYLCLSRVMILIGLLNDW